MPGHACQGAAASNNADFACREWTGMARDACDGPLQAMLLPGADGQAELPAVWAACKEGVMHALQLLSERDPQNIGRVLDVCQVSRDSGLPCKAPVRMAGAAQQASSFVLKLVLSYQLKQGKSSGVLEEFVLSCTSLSN